MRVSRVWATGLPANGIVPSADLTQLDINVVLASQPHIIVGATSDHTYHASDAEVIEVPAISGDITYTIPDAYGEAGDSIEISLTDDSANYVHIYASTTLASLRRSAGYLFACKIRHNGSLWRLVGTSVYLSLPT